MHLVPVRTTYQAVGQEGKYVHDVRALNMFWVSLANLSLEVQLSGQSPASGLFSRLRVPA
jgi:hypothetical protein